MIRNHITQSRKTQKGFRTELEKMGHPWVHDRRGVYVKTLQRYINQYLEEKLPDWECTRCYSRNLSNYEFDLLLNTSSIYTIFNYDGHYSPLGLAPTGIKKDYDLTIYDVDWVQDYSREFTYKLGEGEYVVSYPSFLRKLKRQKRSILYIRRRE